MSNDLATWIADHGFTAMHMLRPAFGAMVAILFLQSGLDKVINWKGEKAFMTGHFEKSILKGLVPVMLPAITMLELAAGACSAIGFALSLLGRWSVMGLVGMTLATVAIIMLFFGQRMSKDYKGAATLVPYFLMCVAGVWVFMVK